MSITNTLFLRTSIRHRLRQKCSRLLRYDLNIPKKLALRHRWLSLRRSITKRKCFIIAGGPSFSDSIAQALLKTRSEYDVIAINFFSESRYSQYISPDIYIVSDPIHLSAADTGSLSAASARLKTFLSVNSPVLVAPYDRMWNSFSDFIVPFNDLEDLSSSNISPIHPRGYTSNTAFKALAVALFLGYDQIVLSGFDHTYANHTHLDVNGKLFLRSCHHYDDSCEDQPLDHFFENSAHAIHGWALNLHSIRLFASDKIINVSDNTLVDTFRKMSISEFLNYSSMQVKK